MVFYVRENGLRRESIPNAFNLRWINPSNYSILWDQEFESLSLHHRVYCEPDSVAIGSNPEGGRHRIGALLLGYYTPEGKLVYAGRAGTGIPTPSLSACGSAFRPIAVTRMPLSAPRPRGGRFGSPLVPGEWLAFLAVAIQVLLPFLVAFEIALAGNPAYADAIPICHAPDSQSAAPGDKQADNRGNPEKQVS